VTDKTGATQLEDKGSGRSGEGDDGWRVLVSVPRDSLRGASQDRALLLQARIDLQQKQAQTLHSSCILATRPLRRR